MFGPVAAFIENLFASWVAATYGPTSMVGIGIAILSIATLVIYWHRNQRAAKKPGMASWQFIALCFIVALLASAAGGYGLGLIKTNPLGLGTTNPQSPPPAPPPKQYTAYEKEQRLRAVDEIYNVIATEFQPIYKDGNKLLDQIYRGSVQSDAEQRLVEYRDKVQSAFDDLNRLLKKYDYFSDIILVAKKNTFNDVEATHGVGNLVPEIQALRQKVPNDISWFLLRDTTMMDARNQMRRFDQYISDTTKGLQEKRAEIETAGVYSGQ